MDKRALRLHFKKLRESLSIEEWLERSLKICEHLYASTYYAKAKKIASYFYINKEVNLWPLLEKALLEGKDLFLPRTHLESKRLTFHRVNSLSELSPGAFGIPEPPLAKEEIHPSELELILVPGLAFDHQGGRLGYGGGFYDRVLGQTKALKVGIAFSFQLVESLPMEAFDERVDLILTESGFFTPLTKSKGEGRPG